MGIVQAMVNVPHEEPGMTRTAPGGILAPPAQLIGAELWSSKDSLNVIDDLPSFHCKRVPAGTSYVWRCSLGSNRDESGAPGGATSTEFTGYFTSSPPSALTTTFPSPASAVTMMNRRRDVVGWPA